MLARSCCLAVLVFAWLLPMAPVALAQQFGYDREERRPTQAVFGGQTVIDFQYNGSGQVPTTSFVFTSPAYGLTYTRPNLMASIAFGEQAALDPERDPRPLRLVDAAFTLWGEFLFATGRRGAPARVYVPIALHSGYRRVAPEGEENSLTESFNVTVFGLGAGLAFEGRLGATAIVEARALPIAGLSVRSFGDAAGSTYLVDTDVQLHLGRLVDRFGASVGYGFRYQVWNGSSSTLLADLTEDLFDYKGTQHVIRVGVNW